MGAAVVRLGDYCTGHGCFPPRPNISASPNVLVNGRGWHRLGDGWASHCCPGFGCHGGQAASGSSTVFINGRPACRVGDAVSCGSRMRDGSDNVFCG